MSLSIIRHAPFVWENLQLSYVQYGEGQRIILAFHGFGQNKNMWLSVAQALGNGYCIYSFDLFFHGESIWPYADKPIEKQQLNRIIQAFLQEKNIQEYSLMGFSLGAKLALCLAENPANKLKKILLMAPDGLHNNFWYRLATGSRLARYIFKSLILNATLWHKITTFLRVWHIIDKKLLKFAISQMQTPEKRSQVYYSWCVFRRLTPDLLAIKNHKCDLIVWAGQTDKVIPVALLESELKNWPHSDLVILPANHINLLQKVAQYYKQYPIDI